MKLLTLLYADETIKLPGSGGSLKIGRSELNDLVFYEQTVSENHGRIFYTDAQFFYQDRNSQNGTLILDREGIQHFVKGESWTLTGSGKIFLGNRSTGPCLEFTVEESGILESLSLADEIGSLFEEGLSSLRLHQHGAAFNIFETLIQKSPREMDLYYYAGFSAWKLDRLDEAVLRFEQYLMIRPEESGVMTDLGKIYERMGKIGKARLWYGNAARKEARCPEAEKLLKNLERFRGYGASPFTRYKTREILNTGEKSIHRSPHFNVHYRCDHLDILKIILKDLEAAYLNIGKFLNFHPRQKINVQLAANALEPSGKTDSNGIMLYVSAYDGGEKNFVSVLIHHEYAHYALGSLTRFSRTIPWWFHEGFAQFMSQNIIPDRLLNLKRRNEDLKFPDLDLLENVPWKMERNQMNIAYLAAHGAVTYLVKTQAPGKLTELIHAFIETGRTDLAFSRAKLDYWEFKAQAAQWLLKSAETGRIKLTQKIF